MEQANLAQDPAFTEVLQGFRRQLLEMVSPGAVDRAAKAAQKKKLEELGGMEKIVEAGGFSYTPAPGSTAARVN